MATQTAGPSVGIKVLLVEDDDDVRESTRLILERFGFTVESARDGWEGYAAAISTPPDIAVLDVAMPGLDGIALTKKLRQELGIPIVLLTARDLDSDIVNGLGAGADDYVTKPFDGGVLTARLQAVLRRTRGDNQLQFAELMIDRDAMSVHWDSNPVQLTSTEFKLLMLLIDHRPRVLSRSQILARVWDDSDADNERIVDVNIQRLRAKLPENLILTVRGAGYAASRK